MRNSILALVALVTSSVAGGQTPTVGPLQADLKSAFTRSIEEAAGRLDGVAGWIVTDQTTSEVVTSRNERRLRAA